MFTTYRKRTIVGITAQAFAQLNGINIISFYLPSTLSAAGFGEKKSLLYTAANALPYTAATVATWYLADHWGRRPLLMLGGVLMAVLLGIVCAFTQADLETQTRANGQYAFVMLYNIVYGFTWGPMPWLLPAEIFPLRSRSKGMALATFSNWIFNFIIGKWIALLPLRSHWSMLIMFVFVGMVSPDAFAGIGGYFYVIIGGFCLISAALAKWYYIETSNLSLEEIATAFGDKAFADNDEEVMAQATGDKASIQAVKA
jgi:MFS family permease